MSEKINIEEHLGLAKKLAWSYAVTSRVDFKDLVSEAYLALVMAAKGYNSVNGAKFSTYAHTTITNHLNKYMNSVNEIRYTEMHMSFVPDVILDLGEGLRDEAIQEEPKVVRDVWTKNWLDTTNWSEVFIGIEKDIYNLYVMKVIFKKGGKFLILRYP